MDNKLIILIVVAIIAVIVYMMCRNTTVESFMGMSAPGMVKIDEISTKNGMPFASVPNWQSNIAPRFNPNSYGPYIQYNVPDNKYLAVPTDPLGYADSVGSEISPEKVKRQLPKYQDVAELLPTATMGAQHPQQVYNWDRLFKVSLAKSNAKRDADFIRGDLPIPKINTGWFSSRYGTEALRDGAMNVIGGQGNETSNALYSYLKNVSGNTKTTFAGAPLQEVPKANMSRNEMLQTTRGISQGDVQVSMYP